MRKLIVVFLLAIFISLTSCANNTARRTLITTSKNIESESNYVTLPDLSGLSRNEITEVFKDLPLELIFAFDTSRYYGNGEYDKFVRYQNRLPGDLVEKGKRMKVFTSQLELPTFNTKELLPFTRDLEGKSFINDSYGYVTWRDGTYADGDTTTFYDPIANEYFKVRFLDVNTKEVSHSYDDPGQPWGVAAGDYIKDRLRNANKIWVESLSDTEMGYDTYFRNLGYVWVDGSCLNLELVSLAYSIFTGNEYSSKYYDVFSAVEQQVSVTGRRCYGEYDPTYNYSK